MTGRPPNALVWAATLAIGIGWSGGARAQPMGGGGGGMPNLRAISGKPLPDRGMPAGTVMVRVARKTPANAAAGVEITALVEGPGGDTRKQSAKTDSGGRATFEGLAVGHRFHAEVVVDGEKLATETFAVPDVGGVRTMLIAGLPPGGDDGEASAGPAGEGASGEGARAFSLGVTSGLAHLDPSLPRGVVEVRAVDEAGQPLVGQKIELGRVVTGTGLDVKRAVTGADGTARFTDVAGPASTGAGGAAGGTAAAVVMDRGGLRLGTDGFAVPDAGGVGVELRVPQRTADPAAITIGAGGRIILQLRDDAVGFIETLPLENHTDKLFDAGPGGVEIPLPREFVGAEAAEGGEHKIEIRKGVGVAVHGPIPPQRPPVADPNRKPPDEVTFGFVLPLTGSTRDFEQRFPNGLGEFTFISDQLPGLVIDSPQITGRTARELGGKKYWLWRGEAVPPGGTLRFTARGLPAPDDTGRNVALALALALVLGAILLSRRGPGGARAEASGAREKLVQRRERLFADLMTAEARRNGEIAVPAAHAKGERDELVRKLEAVYRDLAALDEQRAG